MPASTRLTVAMETPARAAPSAVVVGTVRLASAGRGRRHLGRRRHGASNPCAGVLPRQLLQLPRQLVQLLAAAPEAEQLLGIPLAAPVRPRPPPGVEERG